jgi:hypothetical protein
MPYLVGWLARGFLKIVVSYALWLRLDNEPSWLGSARSASLG